MSTESEAASSESTTSPAERPRSSGSSPVNWPVFTISAVILVAFVLWAWLWPDQAETVIFGTMDWVTTNFGWYYVLTATIIVLFVIFVAFSRVGRTKMGPDHSTPKFNMFTWAAMLFAAGIGVDLMFFGISGPATNYLTPPDVAPMSDEAARMAPLWTMFQYGIPGWAMYALMGMAFGLFAYRYNLPLSLRSILAPIFGRRVRGAPGHAAEVIAVIGTIFGIAVTLGIGVVFLNYGLSALFGIPTNTAVQVSLVVLAVFVTIISTVSGVDRGIRRLSEMNVVLAIILMLWVLFSGKTNELLNALVQNIGDFFSRFPSMMMNTFAYTDGTEGYPSDQWMADWTLFFWAWWIAWAPFVGLFLARISRGRTLRQFVTGVLLIPFGFILLWISIFGNGALSFFRAGETEFLNQAVELPESGFFTLLEQYPGATFTIALAVITGLLFYVTSADSGSLVLSTMTSKPSNTEADGPPWLRIVWALITGALTLVMLFIDGVYTTQAATLLVGLPFSIVIYLVMISVWRVLRSEAYSMDSREESLAGALANRIRGEHDRDNWRQRLVKRMSFPNATQVDKHVQEVVAPAVEEVAAELDALGVDVSCERGTHPEYPITYVDLVVRFPEQDNFKYQAYPVAYAAPSFATSMRTVEETYFKLEIFSLTGSQGRNIMGNSKEQVIADVLDSYDAYLSYLIKTGDKGTPTGELHAGAPSEWQDSDHLDPATGTSDQS